MSIGSPLVNHIAENVVIAEAKGGVNELPTNGKRVTVTVAPSVKRTLDTARKEVFFNCSQAEMLRNLIDAGLTAFGVDNNSTNVKIKERNAW